MLNSCLYGKLPSVLRARLESGSVGDVVIKSQTTVHICRLSSQPTGGVTTEQTTLNNDFHILMERFLLAST